MGLFAKAANRIYRATSQYYCECFEIARSQRTLGLAARARLMKCRILSITCEHRDDAVKNKIVADCRKIPGNIIVMDIGCAAGAKILDDRAIASRELAQALEDASLSNVAVIGIDLDLTDLLAAIKIGYKAFPPYIQRNLSYVQADAIVNLGVPRESLDIVRCLNVIINFGIVNEKEALISNIFASLKVGGKLYINGVRPHDLDKADVFEKTQADVDEISRNRQTFPQHWRKIIDMSNFAQ